MPPSNTGAFDPATTSTKGTGGRSEITACQEEDARLEALLLEGLASGDPIPVDEEYWKDLKGRTEEIAAENTARKANFWDELRAEAECRVESRKTRGVRG
jgi:hypothetical protein